MQPKDIGTGPLARMLESIYVRNHCMKITRQFLDNPADSTLHLSPGDNETVWRRVAKKAKELLS